jgi:hypothetical protein
MMDQYESLANLTENRFRDTFHRFAEVRRDIERIDEAIRGNGKPGLNQEVADIKHRLDELEETDLADLAGRVQAMQDAEAKRAEADAKRAKAFWWIASTLGAASTPAILQGVKALLSAL